jgi:hypothetical protein
MARRIEDLRNEARYWRERHDLYLAKTRGPRATTPGRLRELERTARAAEDRLGRAEAAARSDAGVVSEK